MSSYFGSVTERTLDKPQFIFVCCLFLFLFFNSLPTCDVISDSDFYGCLEAMRLEVMRWNYSEDCQ